MSRRTRLILVGAATFIVVAGALFFLLFPSIGTWVMRSRVLPRMAERLGRDLSVGSIKVGYGDVVLSDIRVWGPNDGDGALLTVDRVRVDFDFWRALRGDVRLGKMEVEAPRVALVRTPTGEDNYHDIVARLRGGGDGAPAAGGGSRVPTAVVVRHGAARYEDKQNGVQVLVDDIGGTAAPRGRLHVELGGVAGIHSLGPRFHIAALTMNGDTADLRRTAELTIAGGSASLWPKMSLTDIRGTVTAAAEPGRAVVALEGGYGGAGDTLWRAQGWLDPIVGDGEIHLKADRFTLDKIEKILAGTPIQNPAATSIDASLDVNLRGGDIELAGALNLSGLTVYHEWLAADPVRDLSGHGTIRARILRRARVVELDELAVSVRGVELRLSGQAALDRGLEPDGSRREHPRLRAHIVVPSVSCQEALEAIPRELAPRLQGFRLKGNFAADVAINVDWADLDALELGGSIGIFGCKAADAPAELRPEALAGEFEHVVELEENNFMSFVVGPENPDFVPFPEVSRYLIDSLISTEDSSFLKHKGFIMREFRSALIKDLKEGYFKYGASSITMQIAKNVFLQREKTLSRKLQELFLTWYLETVVPKERLLEIYVNVIEFGPGLYGIGPAAAHYFGKRARDLNPLEAAFFSSILPSPKKRYLQYCEGELNRWGDAKVQRILKLNRERNLITEEEYRTALASPLQFARTETFSREQCVTMTRRMIQKARPTTPKKRGG